MFPKISGLKVTVTAMSFTVTPPSPSVSYRNQTPHPFISHPILRLTFHFQSLLQPCRRISIFPCSNSLGNDHRNWTRPINSDFAVDDDQDDEEEEEEEEDRSLDLLVRFVQNVFKKISKRARKAVRSILPVSISTKLVEFSVNGVLLLAFLWILKAFLENIAYAKVIDEAVVSLVCTLGSMVFVSILLIRGMWSGVTYFQEKRNFRLNEFDDDHRAWNGTQPAT